jgi:hypothetical protein
MVYVDSIVRYPGARAPFREGSCHMTADTLEELHVMADRIGLARAWFQDHPKCQHYDLTPGRRRRAVELGAVEETCRAGARRRRVVRGGASR